MIGEVMDTFRNNTSAGNKKFVRKSQIETSTYQSLKIKNGYCNQVFSGYAFAAQYFTSFHSI